jgi:hypothetical protein
MTLMLNVMSDPVNAVLNEIAAHLLDMTKGQTCQVFLWDEDLGRYVLRWPLNSSDPLEVSSYGSIQEIESGFSREMTITKFELPGTNRILGLSYVTNPTHDVSPDEVGNFLSEQSIKIESERLRRTEERQEKYMRLLRGVSEELRADIELVPKVKNIAKTLQIGFRCEALLVFLRDPNQTSMFSCIASSPERLGLVDSVSFEEQGLNLFTSNFTPDVDVVNIKQVAHQMPLIGETADSILIRQLASRRLRGYLAVRIRAPNRTLGYLLLINKVPSGPGHRVWFTNQDSVLVESVGRQLVSIIDSWLRDQVVKSGRDAFRLLLALASRFNSFVPPEEVTRILFPAKVNNQNATVRLEKLLELEPDRKEELGKILADLKACGGQLVSLQSLCDKRATSTEFNAKEEVKVNDLFSDIRDFVNESGLLRSVSLVVKPITNQPTLNVADASTLKVLLLASIHILSNLVNPPPKLVLDCQTAKDGLDTTITCSLDDEGKYRGLLQRTCFGKGPAGREEESLRFIWTTIHQVAYAPGSELWLDLADNVTGMVLVIKR